MDNLSAFDRAIAGFNGGLERRLAAGHQFNAYEDGGMWAICLGPVTNAFHIATTDYAHQANLIVAALRAAAGQPEPLCEASDTAGDGA